MLDDDRLYRTVGRFVVSFGRAEHQLTRILAHLLGYKDFEKFIFLVKRMDLHSKIKNIEDASKLYSPMGKNIKSRIYIFENILKAVRNNLLRSDIILKKKSICCMGVGVTIDGRPDNVRPKGKQPICYTLAQIECYCGWLDAFQSDLDECADSIWKDGPFEVVAPRSQSELN